MWGSSGARMVLALPDGAVVAGVPARVVSDQGKRALFRSDVLPFAQMAEQVNRSLSLAGSKIPSGAFNAMLPVVSAVLGAALVHSVLQQLRLGSNQLDAV